MHSTERLDAPLQHHHGGRTTQIVPFPSTRRVGLIRMLVRTMAQNRPEAGERILAARLEVQWRSMSSRGLAPEVVERELQLLELAVRARLRTVMRGGDAA